MANQSVEIQRAILILQLYLSFMENESDDLNDEDLDLVSFLGEHSVVKMALNKSPELLIPMIVQVNGKMKGHIAVTKTATRSEIEELALNEPEVIKAIDDQVICQIVIAPNRFVNIIC